jgi:tetratricopeptide (TPR) repeat protein
MIAIESGDDRLVQEFLPQLPDGPEATLFRLQDYLARQAWPEILDLLAKHSDLVPETERPLAQAAGRLAALVVARQPVGESDLEPVVQFAATDARASVLVAGFAGDRGLEQASEAAFQAALAALKEDGHIANRLMVAHLAEGRGKPRIVADLLLGHVDETHDSRHLRSLARALVNNVPIREGAVDFFARLPDSLRNHPIYVYGEGLLHFNRGALPEAEDCLRRAIVVSPNLIDRRLAMFAVLNRKGQGDSVKAALDGLDLNTAKGKPDEKMHVAQLLRHAGEGTKGMAYGYETLRAARNDPDASLRYLGLVLLLPEGDGSIPVVDAVSVDTWVALAGEGGTITSFVIEGTDDRASDGVVSPTHPLAAAALGRHVGDEFTVPAAFGNVRTWRVVEVKHKYLHAAHEVLATFEQRFPDSRGFYTVHMRDDDIAPVLEQVRRASEWHRSLVDLYVEQDLPLNMVASRSEQDTIGFAEYVRLHGFTIQACVGVEQERLEADELISQRRAGGAVLDTYAAWTAASMDALDVVEGVFGSLQVARSTIDELQMLRDSFRLPPDGASLLTVAWRNGQFFREEHTAQQVQASRTRVEEQISKIKRHCEIVPSAAPNNPSELAIALTETFHETVLDAGIIAARGRLLVSEDRHYRRFVDVAVDAKGVWLHAVFMFARQARLIDQARYAGLVSQLAVRRHSHVAITAQDMLDELHLNDDAEGWRINALAEFIGTKNADLASHLYVVQGFLGSAWAKGEPPLPVARVTGAILRNLLRHRINDWAWILKTLLASSRGPLRGYIIKWMRGHMILPHDLEAAYQESNARIGRARPVIEERSPSVLQRKSTGAKSRRRNKRRR